MHEPILDRVLLWQGWYASLFLHLGTLLPKYRSLSKVQSSLACIVAICIDLQVNCKYAS